MHDNQSNNEEIRRLGLGGIDGIASPVSPRKKRRVLLYVICGCIIVAAVIVVSALLSTKSSSNLKQKNAEVSHTNKTTSKNAIGLSKAKITQANKNYLPNFGEPFSPVDYSSEGNKDIELPSGTVGNYFLIVANHPGKGVFQIDELDTNGNPNLTILDKKGKYSGSRIGVDTKKLRITSGSSWSIKILPIGSLAWLVSPTHGIGDMPYFLVGSKKDIILNIDYNGSGTFALIQNGTNKIFEHPGPYHGEVTLPLARDIRYDPSILQVFADGNWTIN